MKREPKPAAQPLSKNMVQLVAAIVKCVDEADRDAEDKRKDC